MMVKEVRDKTGAGIMDCKNALLEAGGDADRAYGILREQGWAKVERMAERTTSQGLVEAYVHPGEQVGALIELNCESDFVAHTDEFKQLAHNLVLQVVASAPQFIFREEVPEGMKLDPKEVCLLHQPYIKDEAKTIQEIVAETAAKVGERISIKRFARFESGK
jgi:elongation factor Ts